MSQAILWSAERRAYVRHLWPFHTASDIAIRNGVTKNAISGLVFRMGLPPKLSAAPRITRPRKPKPKKKKASVKKRPNGLPLVPLIDLKSNQCHWPFGDPQDPDFGYCGQEVCEKHPSYCDEHRILGTIKNTKKRRVRA